MMQELTAKQSMAIVASTYSTSPTQSIIVCTCAKHDEKRSLHLFGPCGETLSLKSGPLLGYEYVGLFHQHQTQQCLALSAFLTAAQLLLGTHTLCNCVQL
jgi:uncharacterized protein YjaZ